MFLRLRYHLAGPSNQIAGTEAYYPLLELGCFRGDISGSFVVDEAEGTRMLCNHARLSAFSALGRSFGSGLKELAHKCHSLCGELATQFSENRLPFT